jgi:hypothetical protein
MKQIARIWYAIFCILTMSINAFVPVIDINLSSSVSLNLHPRQAAELEACACECYVSKSDSYSSHRRRSLHHDDDRMKSMMMTNGSPTSMINHKRPTGASRRSAGPVAWCLRVVSGNAVNRRRHG